MAEEVQVVEIPEKEEEVQLLEYVRTTGYISVHEAWELFKDPGYKPQVTEIIEQSLALGNYATISTTPELADRFAVLHKQHSITELAKKFIRLASTSNERAKQETYNDLRRAFFYDDIKVAEAIAKAR